VCCRDGVQDADFDPDASSGCADGQGRASGTGAAEGQTPGSGFDEVR